MTQLRVAKRKFITEHYWGYTAQKDGSTDEYKVEHPKWQVWRAGASQFDCDVAALYGEEFAPYLSKEPSSAFLAETAVTVYEGTTLRTA